ncbi:MAG: tyrosine-type recombinase/integrase [Bacteroidota bacterium]
MYIQEHLNSFHNYLKFERRYSPHTITAYLADITDFIAYYKQLYETDEIQSANHKQIRSWIVGLMNEGIIPKSINRKISSLRTFYKFLVSKNIVETNPVLKINGLKTPKRLPQFVDIKDMTTLLEGIEFTDDYEGRRDQIIIELFYATGMRLSELCALETSSIDSINGLVKVLGKGNKERLIPIHPQLLQKIQAYIIFKNTQYKENQSFLFLTQKGEKIYHKLIYRKIKSYLSLVTTLHKKSPHILRHTFATHMVNEGAELNAVKEILGHSSLAATQVYTHNTIQKLKNVHKQAHPKS